MKKIFITATNTNIGKTYTTLKLIPAFSKMGYKVGVFKPIETGIQSEATDAKALLEKVKLYNKSFKNITIDDICPIQFTLPAAPIVSNNLQKIELEPIFQAITKLSAFCDILLIEGAGGLMVPINKDYFMLDLYKALDAKLLLVTHDQLGCINDTLLHLKLFQNEAIEALWCVNIRNKTSFEKITLPYYQQKFGTILRLDQDIEKIAKALIADRNRYGNT